MKKTYEFKKQMSGEYLEAFENAELYYELSNIDETIKESCLNEIGDLLINAKDTERPVDKVLGKSIERFCKKLRNSYAPYWKIEKIVTAILYCASFTFGWGMCDYIYNMLTNSNSLPENLAPILFAILISILLVNSILYIIRRFQFSRAKLHSKAVKFISKFYSFLYMPFAIIIVDFVPVFSLELTLGHLFILLVLSISLYIVILTLFNKKSVAEISEHTKDVLLEQYRREYSKTNKKRLKKGKEPLTQLEMVKKFKVETKIIYNPLLFVLSLGMFLFSLWLLLKYEIQLIPIIVTFISSMVLFLHMIIFAIKKDSYKLIKLLENKELKL